jgi:4-aminobutyrate aminotransferase-like enzyme
LLIFDEIYTGFGRTGKWFACEHSATVPDLICLGKALTGGFPLSACVGRAEVMDAWPPSAGEAIHTSTFLGHPVGCAMALAQIRELRRRDLIQRSAQVGSRWLEWIRDHLPQVGLRLLPRGVGLLAGIELQHNDGSPATAEALHTIKLMLRRRFILLPEGERANVISFTPPLIISGNQLQTASRALVQILAGNFSRSLSMNRAGEGRNPKTEGRKNAEVRRPMGPVAGLRLGQVHGRNAR